MRCLNARSRANFNRDFKHQWHVFHDKGELLSFDNPHYCNDSMGEKISNNDSLNTTILQDGGPYRMLLLSPRSRGINTISAVHQFRYTTFPHHLV